MNIYLNDGTLINDEGKLNIPPDETCYIIAKGGIYLKKKLDLVESLTPVDKISFLEDMPTYASLDIPKIPARQFGSIVGFFRKVESMYKSEAIVLLYYNKSKKTYRIYVPKQEVSGASLSYTGEHTIKDHILIGSIHSHSSRSAFHSGVDVGDEEKFDGIHMTLGKMDNANFFDLCGSIAINALRVPISPEEYVDGLEVREFTNYFPHMFRPSFEEVDGEKIYSKNVKSSSGYDLVQKDGINPYWFNKEWLKQVEEKKYSYSGYDYWNSYNSNGYGGTTRYKIIDGKLVEIKTNEKHDKNKHHHNNKYPQHQTHQQIGYNFYDSAYYRNLMGLDDDKNDDKVEVKVDNKKFIDKCELYCNDCIHRSEKIKLEELNKVPENSCMDNYQLDFSTFDESWGL